MAIIFPKYVTAGDSSVLSYESPIYTPGTYTVDLYLSKGDETPVHIAGVPTTDNLSWVLTLPPDITGNMQPGTYSWTLRVSKAGFAMTQARGLVIVKPDPSKPYDKRTHAAKCLAAVEAVLEGRLTESIAEYDINGTSAKHMSHKDLLAARDRYKQEVKLQQGGARIQRIPVTLGRI